MCDKTEIDIEVEALPANEGDCILVTIIKDDIHILIDGGTAETYRNYLRDCLLRMKDEGKAIDLLIVTHIDNDHIGGIIELIKENGTSSESKIVAIKNIWYNSYRHLQFEKNSTTGRLEKRILNRIIANGEVCFNCNTDINSPISAMQGSTLAGLLYCGKYNWNRQFNEQAVIYTGDKYHISNDCAISVLKPKLDDLDKLGKLWERELKKSKFSFEFSDDEIFDDAFEYYYRCMSPERTGYNEKISYEECKKEEMTIDRLAKKLVNRDSSITNKSSISIIIEYRDKKLLFLADNMAADTSEDLSLEDSWYSLIKLPHHGSASNISDNFIESIDSDKYLISTNSQRYNHPDIETLAKIACKRTKYVKKVYFNYMIKKVIDFQNKINGMDDIEFVYLGEERKIYL